MIGKLRACLYILLSKRCFVVTEDGNRRHYEMNWATTSFLESIVSCIRELVRERRDECDELLKDIDNG